MNEKELENQSSKNLPIPFVAGMSWLLFVTFVVCAHSLNIPFLTLVWHGVMVLLLPVGVLIASVLSTDVIVRFSKSRPLIHRRTFFIAPGLLLACVVVLCVLGNGSMALVIVPILFIPLLVMCGPIIAGTALNRSGVSKTCTFFLAASILLGVAAAPIVLEIGVKSNGDETILSLHPEVILWHVSVLVSILLCSRNRGSCVNGSAERTAVGESLRSSAIVLWTLASALWLVVLHWMLGITEKGSL